MMGETEGAEEKMLSGANPQSFVATPVKNHLAGLQKNVGHWPDTGLSVCCKAIHWEFEFVRLVLIWSVKLWKGEMSMVYSCWC